MRIFKVFWVLGLITTGYGARPRSRQSRSQSPAFFSKTALSQIKSRDPVTFQESQFQTLIDPLNKALQKNQELEK